MILFFIYNEIMQIFTDVNENIHLSLALGYFDGVHLGHQAVIKNAVDFAKKNNIKSAVVTFKDHPCCFFNGVCPKYILSRTEREKRIAKLGIDFIYELDFEKIKDLTAEEYLKNILIKNFRPKAITTGFNHHFGTQKTGDVEYLGKMQNVYNYKYYEVPPQKIDGVTISSTKIRNALSNGLIAKANEMLGAEFSISGKVIEGQKLGRELGFRTANLLYPSELITLPFGAYATKVTLKGEQYQGVTNFGQRPTVQGKNPIVETHILNFDKDIYGEIINIEFTKMLRKEQKFASLDELKTQIKKDICYAGRYL